MIEGPPTLKIRRTIERPDAELVDAFRGAMTGHVVDSMDGRGALDPAIKPYDPESAVICGPALTVGCYPADCLALMAALEFVEPGDVVICTVDGFRETASTGDILAGMFKNKGAVALVTDGSIRDQVGIEAVGLPIFHNGVTPNSPAAAGPGSVGLPINCGGRPVQSGDIVVGDRDGIVIVPQADAP